MTGEASASPISKFHNLHKGETCLLIGNAENLLLTPPELFPYPSFGMNTIHKLGYQPTYYVAVDSRIMREFSEVAVIYENIPKFIPTPNLDKWQGKNFYRFYHRPGALWPRNKKELWPSGLMTEEGITYGNVMHVAMQLAYYMGFSTMLIVGMEHGKDPRNHFWGPDEGMTGAVPVDDWLMGYKELREGMGVKMLNLSVNTFVPDNIIQKDHWMKWI